MSSQSSQSIKVSGFFEIWEKGSKKDKILSFFKHTKTSFFLGVSVRGKFPSRYKFSDTLTTLTTLK